MKSWMQALRRRPEVHELDQQLQERPYGGEPVTSWARHASDESSGGVSSNSEAIAVAGSARGTPNCSAR